MVVHIQSKVTSFFHHKLGKSTKSNKTPLELEITKKTTSDSTPSECDGVTLNQQLGSRFFKLPIEIRKIIYDLVWVGDYDYMYHVPNGRHIHFQDGHWINMRCVMYPEDEEPGFVQKNMDMIYDTGKGDLVMWQRRLSSTWGSRHWRCEERTQSGRQKSVDRTNFVSMMLVCKQMYPEVMESIFESHLLLFNDVFSMHRFLVHQPSPFLSHIRHLDLTLNLPFHEYSPFVINTPGGRVREIWGALEHVTTSLHTLRISLDVYDRGPWRKLPERDLTAPLSNLKVLKDFTFELPPSLPIKTHASNIQNFHTHEKLPFDIVRRPPLRYWQFNPGEVERFTWGTHTKGHQSHCFITLTKEARYIPNPYLFDFSERR
ncbi:hypothetical protein F4779DRAFT_495357 [Xylariaceae sp. FL0662B]|nr:hypothetical protein F4779DRAFT_495357 [Xylariaceae sp. FL0662B]